MKEKIDVSVILPFLNEEKALSFVVEKTLEVLKKTSYKYEIILVNNNSTDKSGVIAEQLQKENSNILVINESKIGYGSAYKTGFNHTSGEILIMFDTDGTYDPSDIPEMVGQIKSGHDFVMTNRKNSYKKQKTMKWLHRYFGNPILTIIIKYLFHSPIKDVYSGFRAIKRSSYESFNMQSSGMEFALEMVIKSSLHNIKITEIDTSYSDRIGESKLRSFRDGWRSLRFILLYAPSRLFFIAGGILFGMGVTLSIYIHTITDNTIIYPTFMIGMLSAIFIILGYQLILFTVFAEVFSITHLKKRSPKFERIISKISINRGIIISSIIVLLGISLSISTISLYGESNIGYVFLSVLNGLILVTIGIQTFFSIFMISTLGIKL